MRAAPSSQQLSYGCALAARCTMLHLDFPEVVHLVDAVEVVLHASDISPTHWTKLQSRCQAPSQLR